jgi:hypothetical protein
MYQSKVSLKTESKRQAWIQHFKSWKMIFYFDNLEIEI